MTEKTLIAHRLLLRAGLSLVQAFSWVFIFEYFYLLSGGIERAFAATIFLYGFAQLITLVMTPVAAARLGYGVRHSVLWGVIIGAAAFAVLGLSFSGLFGSPALWGIVTFATLLGFYRALYWIPYTLARGVLSIAHMITFFEVLVALMPIFAGLTLVSMQGAPARILFGGAVLIALSAIPALFIPNVRERFSWPYLYTYRQLFRRKNQGLVLQGMLEGMHGATLFVLWPLAIFLIVEWSYVIFGIVMSITLLAIMLLRRFYKYFAEKFGIGSSSAVHAFVAVSGWVARFAAGTPVGIVIADVYSYSTQPERGMYADVATLEHASDRGAFLDEYTALKEIALALGRIVLCTVVFFLASAFSLPIVLAVSFLMAAVGTGVSVLIAQKLAPIRY